MNIEEDLKQIKKEYILIKPPKRLLTRGWTDLEEGLDTKPKPIFVLRPILARGLVFASFLILLLGGTFLGVAWASQSALPGDRLYSIKRLSENFILKRWGNGESLIERRGQEIIDLYEKKKDSQLVEEAIRDYEKAVLEAQEEVEKKGDRQGFRQILEKQETKFKEIIEKNPSSEPGLGKAIEALKEGRSGEGKVQGVEEEDKGGRDTGGVKEKKREGRPNSNSARP